jgi:hypothetical protein
MLDRLKALKGVLETSGTLTKADKAFIKKNYASQMGHELITKSGCSNCWHDGLILLINKLSGNKLRLNYGAVVHYNGKPYNYKTITDEIQEAVLKENPELKKLFYGM